MRVSSEFSRRSVRILKQHQEGIIDAVEFDGETAAVELALRALEARMWTA